MLRDWRLAVATQALAAIAVGTVWRASAHWWLAVVYGLIGLAGGVSYYRGSYSSLATVGARGFRSALIEASARVRPPGLWNPEVGMRIAECLVVVSSDVGIRNIPHSEICIPHFKAGGGILASLAGLRAPYIPCAILAVALAVTQTVLIVTAHRAHAGKSAAT